MANMLKAALWYAKHNYYIFPLHEAVFDGNGQLAGCTCEDYRQSDECKADHPHLYLGPDGKCANPGKCPRVAWKQRASIDEGLIRNWWVKWPNANIGIHCGKSNLLVLDADKYKETYGDISELLTAEEQETVTVLTGGGGEHLFYRTNDDDDYGNGTGELPPGIDVRGIAGYVVAPPSLHASGNEYKFEFGYGVHEIEPLPIPQKLRDILNEAQQSSATVAFDCELEKPDLNQWRLSGKAVELIYNGQNSDDRSSTDQSAISSLLRAGANDDEIRAVFSHYPIGIEGKYAERGDDYLARSIGRARVHLNGHLTGQHEPTGIVTTSQGIDATITAEPVIVEESLLLHSADDEGNAQCVNALHPNKFLYCNAYGWLRNINTHWDRSDIAERDVNRTVTHTLIQRRIAAVHAEDEKVVKASRPTASNKKNTKEQLRDIVWVDVGRFDREEHLLNCKNGVIDLRNGELLTREASAHFTYCVNAEYHKDAKQDFWLSFLSETVKNYADVAEWLQMACGYSISGFTNEEIMFYLFGPTRSGKGTFTNAFLHLLGNPLGVGINFSTFTSRRDGDAQNFDLAGLKPSRFIAASESGKYQSLNEAVIKQITGNDSIRASFKGKDHFEFFPQFKIWLSSNHPVKGDVDDDAFWGRVKVIEFPNSHLGNEDKSLKARMQSPEAATALLSWAVEGTVMWYNDANGLKTPETVEQSTTTQRAEQDSVQGWLDEYTITKDGAESLNSELYSSYVEWCKDNGATPKHSAMFGRAMGKKGFEKISIRKPGKNPARGYRGIGLVSSL